MGPKIIRGGYHCDDRGNLRFNNDFDVTKIKRFYTIQNRNTSIIRGWQGHKIEQRWFSAIQGKFSIKVIKIDDWKNPSRDLEVKKIIVSDNRLDVLHVPAGCITCLQALEEGAKLLVMADYLLGETEDEFRFPVNYFN